MTGTLAESTTLDRFAAYQRSFSGGPEALLQHYHPDAVVVAEDGYEGQEEIRIYLESFIRWWPPGATESFRILSRRWVGPVLMLRWEAPPWVRNAVETIVFRGDRIAAQTVAMEATIPLIRRGEPDGSAVGASLAPTK